MNSKLPCICIITLIKLLVDWVWLRALQNRSSKHSYTRSASTGCSVVTRTPFCRPKLAADRLSHFFLVYFHLVRSSDGTRVVKVYHQDKSSISILLAYTQGIRLGYDLICFFNRKCGCSLFTSVFGLIGASTEVIALQLSNSCYNLNLSQFIVSSVDFTDIFKPNTFISIHFWFVVSFIKFECSAMSTQKVYAVWGGITSLLFFTYYAFLANFLYSE